MIQITEHRDNLYSPEVRASRKVLIFANPVAGRGRALATAQRIALSLTTAGYTPELILTPPQESILPDGPFHAAISIGGDGTLRSVVSRLCVASAADKPTLNGPFTPPPPILVVPTGTANLMRQSLGLPRNTEKILLELLRDYHVVPRDAALANAELFLIVAGVGLDGQVIHELARRRTGPITHLSYLIPTALSVRNWTYPQITVHVDGKLAFGPTQGMAMVGHVKEHGIGFSFLSQADPTDRKLDVLAFPCKTFLEGVGLLLATTAGRLPQMKGTLYTTANQTVTIATPEPTQIPVQVDGESAGFSPLTVELFPHQIPFIAPKP